MKLKRKYIITLIIASIVTLIWQQNLFNRFNYFTAKLDIIKNSPKIVSVGLPINCGDPCVKLNTKYGFEEYNFGCVITDLQLKGVKTYNLEIEKHLKKKNGEHWRKDYEKEFDSIVEEYIKNQD